MANDEIAKRYASAIYNIAKSSDSINEVREVLNVLLENYEEEEEFRKILESNKIKIFKGIQQAGRTDANVSAKENILYINSKDVIDFFKLKKLYCLSPLAAICLFSYFHNVFSSVKTFFPQFCYYPLYLLQQKFYIP